MTGTYRILEGVGHSEWATTVSQEYIKLLTRKKSSYCTLIYLYYSIP